MKRGFGLNPLVAELVSAAQESVVRLRARIADVKYGPIESNEDVIAFRVDGKLYKGVLRGRNACLVLGGSPLADASIALRVLVDGDACPAVDK